LPPRYDRHLEATTAWLRESVARGRGGSAAYATPIGTWARPYPETTGYLLPTLLALGEHDLAARLSSWLLAIQQRDGWWAGGTHPSRSPRASVFNTAQIVHGLVACAHATGDERLREPIRRAASWLASGVGSDGLWAHRDYRAATTPTYYTHAAWPMLEAAAFLEDDAIETSARRVLDAMLARRRDNGAFAGWGFGDADDRAFTHTIAYTLRGFLGAAEVLGDWARYGDPVEQALAYLYRRAELTGGALPGSFDSEWRPDERYVCLTGNAQLAICILLLERRAADLRLVNGAAKLVDEVCRSQRVRAPLAAVRGAVPGSRPLWGRYMVGRYPNWAAKYHCDALLLLTQRLAAEASR
jgi:hypothetical protein